MPDEGGCAQCWDFLYVQFQVNGVTVDTRLIGVPGSIAQLRYANSTVPVCTNGAGTVGLIVQYTHLGGKRIGHILQYCRHLLGWLLYRIS
jgi:hypothetical protein